MQGKRKRAEVFQIFYVGKKKKKPISLKHSLQWPPS